MDPRLQHEYERELQHIRDLGGEFAEQFPKIAGRLGLESFKCADPYVERLLEGLAFLTARIQIRLDAEHPRFTEQLLSMVLPQYLAPTPSMLVAQFEPTPTEGGLAEGLEIERGTSLRTLATGDDTTCQYRTGHAVTLWPLKVAEATYLAFAKDIAAAGIPTVKGAKAAIRICVKTTADVPVSALALDALPIFVRGSGGQPVRILEQILGDSVGLVVRPLGAKSGGHVLPRSRLRPRGYGEDEALLPRAPRSFEGYRLLREYFAFPERFSFVEFAEIGDAVRAGGDAQGFELIVLLDRPDASIEETLDADNFALFCAPAINLFRRRADRVALDGHSVEHHVVVDRTRPMDFEVFDVASAVARGGSDETEQEFLPFYASFDRREGGHGRAYYTLRREPRRLSARQRQKGKRSKYVGGETFMSLVDGDEAPFRADLKQLALEVWCTNRDLPLHAPVGQSESDFTMDLTLPLDRIRCIEGPTRPRESRAEGDVAWRLIHHLALNYVSLLDSEDGGGAEAIREILRLYADAREPHLRRLVDEGLVSVSSKVISRRMPMPGPMTFGRGLEIELHCDEGGFEGSGVFLFGAVMEQFFAKYVSLNSFTETVLSTAERGEIMRWPARLGRRSAL